MTDPTHDNAMAGRFDPLWSCHEMLECPEGQYVRSSDYAALQSALEAATARADKAEAERSKGWDANQRTLATYRTAQANVLAERDAALSRVTEAKAEGMRAAYDAVVAMEWTGDGDDVCDVLRALAQSGGADPAQGGRE